MSDPQSCSVCITHFQENFVDCYFDQLINDIRHRIHLECKACHRGKMLKLRPGKNHICGTYENNLKSAYDKYGLECMKGYAKSEWARTMIGDHFMEANREDWGYIDEEHHHVPGVKNWIPVSYYFNNFWKIDILISSKIRR